MPVPSPQRQEQQVFLWVSGCGRKVRWIDVPAVTRKSLVTHNGGLVSVPTSAEAIGIQPCSRSV